MLGDGGHSFQFWVYNTSGTFKRAYWYNAVTYPLAVNTWVHVVGVYDGAANTVKAYIDTVEVQKKAVDKWRKYGY